MVLQPLSETLRRFQDHFVEHYPQEGAYRFLFDAKTPEQFKFRDLVCANIIQTFLTNFIQKNDEHMKNVEFQIQTKLLFEEV